MAVYFQPQYKPWWADLANTALKEGLSGLMKGMFERDAYARQKNRSNKEWAQVFGTPAQQVAAQEATQQPAAMTVESSPDTNRLSSAITGATQTSPFGSDAIGFAQTAPKVNVPKQFLPTENDGLLGTSNKAVMANNYVNSQVPTREELMRRVLTTMGPQNQEAAVKYLEYMYGPQWKVGDQIYKGRQMENILGTLPGMQDKEGNRNYNARATIYGLGDVATGNLNFINPEYQRWFNEAEAAKQRAFTGRENALNRGTQMAIARMNDARMRQLAAMKAAGGGGAGRGGTANPFAGMSWGDMEKLNKMAQSAMPLIAGKTPEEARRILNDNYDRFAPLLEARFKNGNKDWTYTGKDNAGVDAMLTGANPFFTEPAQQSASVLSFAGGPETLGYAGDEGLTTDAFGRRTPQQTAMSVNVPRSSGTTNGNIDIGKALADPKDPMHNAVMKEVQKQTAIRYDTTGAGAAPGYYSEEYVPEEIYSIMSDPAMAALLAQQRVSNLGEQPGLMQNFANWMANQARGYDYNNLPW